MAGSLGSGSGPSRRLSVADLKAAPAPHTGTASEAEREAVRARFGLAAVDALSWDVQSAPWRAGLRLSGRIRAQVTQDCVVTLDPVPATIDETFDRGFLPLERLYGEEKPGSEHEIVADSELGEIPEPLTDPLDLMDVIAEELGVALDPYPRREGLEELVYSAIPKGAVPIEEADIKPFASLAALKKKMDSSNGTD